MAHINTNKEIIITAVVATIIGIGVLYVIPKSPKKKDRIEFVEGSGAFDGIRIYRVDGHEYFKSEFDEMQHLETCTHESHTE
jgi:hypothetical protein